MADTPRWYHRIPVSGWLFAGLIVQTALYGWTYGVFGRQGAPGAWLRLQVYPLLFLVYSGLVWMVCRRHEGPGRERLSLTVMLVGAVVVRGTVLSGMAPHNGDVDRYQWEGLVLLKGFNPYAAPPKSAVYDGVRAWLDETGDDLYTRKWTRYAGIRTVYGPVATGLFTLPWLFPGRRTRVWRSLMVLFDLATVLVLVSLAGVLERRPLVVLTYAWSPIAVNAFADRGQLDAVLVLFVVLSALFAVRAKPVLAGVSFAAAVSTKLSPLPLLLPLLRVGGLRLGGAFLTSSVLAVLPFAGAGSAGLRGLSTFARRWETCDSLFPLARTALAQIPSVTAPAAGARYLVTLALLGYAVWLTLSGSASAPGWLVNRMTRIAAAMIWLSPVTFPWYVTTMLALVALRPQTSLLALATVPMLWYIRFVHVPASTWYHHLVEVWGGRDEPWRVPAYGTVAALLLRDRLNRRRSR